MPTPRPVYVSPYAESILRIHVTASERPSARRIADDEGSAEVFVYQEADIPALRRVVEQVDAMYPEPTADDLARFATDGIDFERDMSVKRQLREMLGYLSIMQEARAQFPYSDEIAVLPTD